MVTGSSVPQTLRSRAGLLRYKAAGHIAQSWVERVPRKITRQRRTFSELMALSRASRRDAYAAAAYEFHHRVPARLREHRAYFSSYGRGYGSDPFHGTWWLLMQELRPQRCLEIGVFRGQVISLWTLCADELDLPCEVHGISPLGPVQDSWSAHPEDIDYESDIRASFDRFQLTQPVLVESLSTGELAVAHERAHEWDLIYVDGSHDYDVVKSDLALAAETVRPGGFVVADDAALFLGPPIFRWAFMGIEDPSQAVMEIPSDQLERIGSIGHMVFLQKPL